MTTQSLVASDIHQNIAVQEDAALTSETTVATEPANRDGTARAASAGDEQHPGTVIGRSARDDGRFASGDRRQQAGHGRSPHRPAHGLLDNSSTSSHELPTTMHDLVRSYVPLLSCPACSPPSPLVAPTTLHCGHTVCARHVRTGDFTRPSPSSSASASSVAVSFLSLTTDSHASSSNSGPGIVPNASSSVPVLPTCPLLTCRPRARRQVITPNIPPESTVAYYPPIVQPITPELGETNRITVSDPRLDVSVGRVLHLLGKARSWQTREDIEQRLTEESNGSDDESPEEEGNGEDAVPKSGSRPSTNGTRRRSRPASRSRKRSRKDDNWDGRHYRHRTREELVERFNKELSESLTCEICFMLLYQPVTTPCQHTFCAKCLQRSLDHGTKCPLCRQEMPPFSYFQDHPFNKVVLSILLKAYPEGYAERGRAIEEEERDGRLNTPIFVCQLSFPGIPTLLHFYEPRYRLMLRRCLESPIPCFGMIMPQRTVGAGSSDYGTMLEIKSVQMLPDGRSMVETIGTHRFRIMETGTLDGYMVGRIERIDDIPRELEDEAERSLSSLLDPSSDTSSTGEPSSNASPSRIPPPTADELIAICHGFVEQLRNGTAPWVVQRLNNTYGPMPNDVNRFSFWMAQVLPIEEHEKAKLLVIRSARARLRLVVHWIEQLNSNWWFSRGCSIS
ncbi:hypothetical protein ACEPAF_6408 [Sanghuangporus sanghuang]